MKLPAKVLDNYLDPLCPWCNRHCNRAVYWSAKTSTWFPQSEGGVMELKLVGREAYKAGLHNLWSDVNDRDLAQARLTLKQVSEWSTEICDTTNSYPNGHKTGYQRRLCGACWEQLRQEAEK